MITPCEIPDVLMIQPRRIEDDRGYFVETDNPEIRSRAGLPIFVQENESFSRTKGTLRGLHLQTPPYAQAKLVRCVRGAILDVAVDIRSGSPTYGKHVALELSADNGRMVFVPAGFAHGFCTLAPDTLIAYKVDHVYSAAHEVGIAWNDPEIGIEWPEGSPPAMSGKDKQNPSLAEVADQLVEVEWG